MAFHLFTHLNASQRYGQTLLLSSLQENEEVLEHLPMAEAEFMDLPARQQSFVLFYLRKHVYLELEL